MVISPHISLIHAGTEYVHNGVGFSLTYFTEGVEFGSKQTIRIPCDYIGNGSSQCTFKSTRTTK